ncbi:Fur family transcriptional regulator [Cellulomonas shaoxiangyii]|uniref:Transcriptional repressor n=1 Tax=Cellulomonas shaoxiangyii TaxID=2566013 RepID=A0A4P7SKK4_9CELL|nr:Fur family transcriptional regulator [Cellulomonas shaoxiangyii]QCB93073.1 transcriptional repressor [Cellulomonas shaoxiangyii]TGY78796.1 transcriptional repressor [Cellulomonas shaoxiangyii]
MIGQRVTRQRTAVAALLDDLGEFRSARQIHRALHERGDDIALATVYRTLNAMAESGDVEVLLNPSGEHTYLRCAPTASHHHHLVCRHCGRTVDVDAPQLEELVSALATEHGFTELEHSVDFVGVCTACARTDARAR